MIIEIVSFLMLVSSIFSVVFMVDSVISDEWINPNYIYDNTTMNFIGCFISTILLATVLPLYYVVYLIYFLGANIVKFIYFLFHVGRN